MIDLQGKSPLADTIIVASGRSARHVSALADHVQRSLKEGGFGKVQVEGLPQADWVLIDVGDVIVHIFRPEVRSFYQLEKIWSVDSAPPHPCGTAGQLKIEDHPGRRAASAAPPKPPSPRITPSAPPPAAAPWG